MYKQLRIESIGINTTSAPGRKITYCANIIPNNIQYGGIIKVTDIQTHLVHLVFKIIVTSAR